MKLAKTKAVLGLVLFGASLVIGVLPPPSKASAAPAPTFVSAKYTALPAPSESNFTFIDPVKIQYTNPSDGSTTDYNLQITKYCQSSGGQSDTMFLCSDTGDTYASSEERGFSYWYWPDDGGTVPNVGGGTYPCASGLVVSIKLDTGRNDGQEVRGATLSVVTPRKMADSSGRPVCSVTANKDAHGLTNGNDPSLPIRASDMEGTGAAAYRSNNVYSTMHVDASNGHYCSGTSGDTADDNGYNKCYIDSKYVVAYDLIQHNYGDNNKSATQDRNTLLGLGTLFHWSSSTELDSYFDSSFKDTLVTNDPGSTAMQSIKDGFKNTTGDLAKYGDSSTYNYYTNQDSGNHACYNSDDQYWSAIIAVSQSDPSQGIVLARHSKDAAWFIDWGGSSDFGNGSGNGSGSSNFWGSIKCLVENSGDTHYRALPAEVWMNPDHQFYTDSIGLGDPGVQLGTTTPPPDPGSGNGQNPGGADPGIDCVSSSLSWLICPVLELATSAAQGLDNVIHNLLTLDVAQTFGSSNTGYYTAWNSFRVIATALLVIAGLIMVVSQALGMEILDAYTIRKVLPRLLIAVIGISLSWPLMKFMVGFFNTLGNDVMGLIQGPFNNVHATVSASTIAITSWPAAILGIGIVAGLFGPAALLFILSALLAAFIAFFILIVRQIGVTLAVILAPLAIACFILPNTQKAWNLWRENFMGLLMMFPIVMAFIAIGHVFGLISLAHGGGLSQIIGLIAYFAPYFLLPLAFRLATGLIANLSGVVNDRGRGLFDRMKNARRNRASENFKKLQNNQRWDPTSKWGKRMNTVGTWATDPLNNAAYYGRDRIPGLRKRGHRVAHAIEHSQLEQSAKLAEEFKAYNDRGLRALTGVHSGLSEEVQTELKNRGMYGVAPRNLQELEAMAEVLRDHGNGAEQNAANAIHGNMGRLATLYQDPEMGKASIAAAGAMALAQHGFLAPKDIPELGDVLQSQGGTGFAQSVIAQAALMGQRSRPDLKNGYGWMYDKTTGKFVDGIHDGGPGGQRDLALIASTTQHDVAGAKGGYLDDGDMGDVYKEVLTSTGDEATQELTRLQNLGVRNEEDQKKMERLVKMRDMQKATKEQLFSWAGPHSQASVDIKAKALQMLEELSSRDPQRKYVKRDVDGKAVRDDEGNVQYDTRPGWKEGSLMDEFERYSRAETDPSLRGEGGPPEPPDAGGAGGGGTPGGG